MGLSIAAVTKGGVVSRLLQIGFLVVLLGPVPPTTVLAGPPEPPYKGPEKCAECHSAETEAWQNSPHAKAMADIEAAMPSACSEEAATDCTCLACHTTDFDPVKRTYVYGGVSCEACHGPYVESHPKDGIMHLDVDSSVCSDCHVDTYQQWQESHHAQAGVQCIGCHLSHSQDFRLTDEALCGACHGERLEDFAHTAHETAGIGCTDCHLSSSPVDETAALASADKSVGRGTVASHRFTVVSSQACVGCHGQTIHEETAGAALSQVANVRLLAMADRAPELAAELEVAEKANKALKVMTLVGVGLGMGVGVMLGIVLMLVVGYVTQGRAQR
jgi:hypothetical protein